MRQPKQLANPLSVEKIVDVDFPTHPCEITVVLGSVRTGR
jgi:hypothetical protein